MTRRAARIPFSQGCRDQSMPSFKRNTEGRAWVNRSIYAPAPNFCSLPFPLVRCWDSSGSTCVSFSKSTLLTRRASWCEHQGDLLRGLLGVSGRSIGTRGFKRPSCSSGVALAAGAQQSMYSVESWVWKFCASRGKEVYKFCFRFSVECVLGIVQTSFEEDCAD